MSDIKPRPRQNNHHRALHRIYVTQALGHETQTRLREFIENKIAGVPLMPFDREQYARRFADEFSARFNIGKEHIAVRAWK